MTQEENITLHYDINACGKKDGLDEQSKTVSALALITAAPAVYLAASIAQHLYESVKPLID